MNTKFFSTLLLLLSSFTLLLAQVNQKDAKGLKQGAWVKKDPTTKRTVYEGQFIDDKPTGLFKYYSESGKLKAITTYRENGTKAYALLFDEKGNKIAEGLYLNEKKDSVWNYFNPDKILIAQESYQNNKKHGTWKIFYEDGKVYEEMDWRNGVKHGAWKQYYKNSTLKTDATYNNGDLDGKMKFFFSDGKPDMIGTYVNAMREGPWEYYNPDGKLKMRELYTKGKVARKEYHNGVFNENYDNDILKSSITYKDGKKNGAFKEYYNAGEWKRRIKPAEGEFPEEVEEYFEGQQLQREGAYLDDQLQGKITTYKPNGKIDKVEVYEFGKLKSK